MYCTSETEGLTESTFILSPSSFRSLDNVGVDVDIGEVFVEDRACGVNQPASHGGVDPNTVTVGKS